MSTISSLNFKQNTILPHIIEPNVRCELPEKACIEAVHHPGVSSCAIVRALKTATRTCSWLTGSGGLGRRSRVKSNRRREMHNESIQLYGDWPASWHVVGKKHVHSDSWCSTARTFNTSYTNRTLMRCPTRSNACHGPICGNESIRILTCLDLGRR